MRFSTSGFFLISFPQVPECPTRGLFRGLGEDDSRKTPASVADPDPNPDPPDPYVFGPPGSGSISTSQRYGSGSFYHHAKIEENNLDSYYFVTLFDFLSLKNDVNVASISRKNLVKKLVFSLHLEGQ